MIVSELIELLKQQPANMEVVLHSALMNYITSIVTVEQINTFNGMVYYGSNAGHCTKVVVID